MSERCPVHRVDLVRTRDAFPGTPCSAEWWCPRGHAARVWEIVNDWGEAELRRQRRTPREARVGEIRIAADRARTCRDSMPLRICGRDAHGFAC